MMFAPPESLSTVAMTPQQAAGASYDSYNVGNPLPAPSTNSEGGIPSMEAFAVPHAQQLSYEHQLLLGIIHTHVVAVILIDHQKQCLYPNKRAEEILECTPEMQAATAAIPLASLLPWRVVSSSGKAVRFHQLASWPVIKHGAPLKDTRIVLECPSGIKKHLLVNAAPLSNAQGDVPYVICSFHDITAQVRTEDNLRHLANYDPLSELCNRRFFLERVEAAIHSKGTQAETYPCSGIRLLYIDLDRFKEVNDTFGHEIGDVLLHCLAKRMKQVVPNKHLLARLGGDEFAVLMSNTTTQDARMLAETLIEVVAMPCEVKGHTIHVGTSIGITAYTQDDRPSQYTKEDNQVISDSAALLRQADMAMYQAKAYGGNTYVIN